MRDDGFVNLLKLMVFAIGVMLACSLMLPLFVGQGSGVEKRMEDFVRKRYPDTKDIYAWCELHDSDDDKLVVCQANFSTSSRANVHLRAECPIMSAPESWRCRVDSDQQKK